MPVKTYNLKDVIMTVLGVPISGADDGDKCKIEFDSELWTKKTGADGEVMRSRVNGSGGKITFTLMYGSALNDYFDGLMKADLLTRAGTVPILIRDTRGRSQYFSHSSWIEKAPGGTYGKEGAPREWVFDCAEITAIHGGITPL